MTLSCQKDQSPLTVDDNDMTVSFTQWNTSDINQYVMTQRRDCFCPYGGREFRITVKDNEITEAINLETGEALDVTNLSFKTIDQLFDFVRSIDKRKVADFEVTYDSKLGYPNHVFVNYSDRMIDEEMAYTTEFLYEITP